MNRRSVRLGAILIVGGCVLWWWMGDSDSGRTRHHERRAESDGAFGDRRSLPNVGDVTRSVPSKNSYIVLRGHVFNEEGKLASGASVQVTSAARRVIELAESKTQDDGSFELRIAQPIWSDHWPIRARAFDGRVDWRKLHSETVRVVARSDTGAASPPYCISFHELHRPLWIGLRLTATTEITARAVTVDRRVVPHAIVRFALRAGPDVSPWDGRALLSSWFEVNTDERGHARLEIPAHHAVAWARKPEGLFGSGKAGSVDKSRRIVLGDVVVAEGEHRVQLRVADANGNPIRGAVLRLEVDDGMQRYLTSAVGDSLVHYRSDAAGVISFTVSPGPQPMIGGIAARGFLPATLVWDRSSSGPTRCEIALEPLHELRVRFETKDGSTLPHDVVTSLEAFPVRGDGTIGAGPGTTEIVTFGNCDARSVQDRIALMDPPPAQFIHERENPVWPTWGDGVLTRRFARPGRYLVRANIAPALAFETFATIQGREAEPIVFEVPGGRVVTLELRLPPELSHGTTRDKLYVWPATAAVPAADWPSTEDELKDAARDSTGFLSGIDGRRAVFWIPDAYGHVFVRRTHRTLRVRRSFRDRLPLKPVAPGSTRWQSSDPIKFGPPAIRAELPRGPGVVTIAVPSAIEPGRAREIRAQVQIGNGRLRQANVLVHLWRAKGDESEPRWVASGLTNEDGEVVFVVEAARYAVHLDRRIGPERPVSVNATGTHKTIKVAVPVLGK